MSQRDLSPFEKCAVASGLLTEKQLDEARASMTWANRDDSEPNAGPTDRQLANRLVEMNLLNVWQAKQLRNGRTRFNLGPYRIVDSIGQGGMGHVFKAQTGKDGPVVAVKVLPRDKTTPEAVFSFTREIRAAGRLSHQRLVTAIDAGQDGNVQYLVTEYVPGLDLRKVVRQVGPLGMAAAASIICQIADALDYAHQEGLVHRDVKPGNVLVTPQGEAKLSDLGLVQSLITDPENDPRYGKIMGTADYVSPDQVRNPRKPIPAWDIYSLGCTLYFAVTGKVPFPGGTIAEKAIAHRDLQPINPRRVVPSLSPEFVDVLADMMEKDPKKRIASGRNVVMRLLPFLPPPLPENGTASQRPAYTTTAGGIAIPLIPIPMSLGNSSSAPPMTAETALLNGATPPESQGTDLDLLADLLVKNGAASPTPKPSMSLSKPTRRLPTAAPLRESPGALPDGWLIRFLLSLSAMAGIAFLAWQVLAWVVRQIWSG